MNRIMAKEKLRDKEKDKGGRPLLFKTPAALEKAIDGYFKECKDHKKEILDKNDKIKKVADPQIPTIAGLAYNLGVDRQTIYNYEKTQRFFDIIKGARNFILSRIEGRITNATGNMGGPIFIAKNYGYADKQEIEMTKPIEVIITDYRGREE